MSDICSHCGSLYDSAIQGHHYYEGYDFDNDFYTQDFSEELRKELAGKFFCCQECEINFRRGL